MKAHNLCGMRFGRWFVTSQAANLNDASAFNCVCDCGTRRVVRATPLVKGKSLSCGCLSVERSSERNRTHGMKGTKEYKAWDCIKQRCYNPRHKSFKDYGERGIVMCPEWLASFEAFLAYIGHAPSKAHSVERIDNSRPYEPANVRWATAREQARNRRSNTIIQAFGEAKTLVAWTEDVRCSVTQDTLGKRLEAGWETERAILTPKYATRYGNRNATGRRLQA